MIIRDFTIADQEDLEATALRAWEFTYGDIYTPDEIAEIILNWYSPEASDRILSEVREGKALFRIATGEAGEGMLGYVSATIRDGIGELARLYVLPVLFGQGLGTALLNEAEAFFREKGLKEYFCMIDRRNTIGLSFYEKRGLARQEQIGDEFRLVKRLGSA